VDVETVRPITLTEKQTAAVRKGVIAVLKDPESARFGSIIAGQRTSSPAIVVCGFVNAKNSFGGYTGEQPFTGILGDDPPKFAVAMMGGKEEETYAVREMCSRSGLAF
jgi:hypothetical protein